MPTPSPLPNATASQRGAISASAQSIGGHKTLEDGVSVIDQGLTRRFRPVINVADYEGVGITDSQAIQAAIDDSQDIGGVVHFEARVYEIDTEVTDNLIKVALRGIEGVYGSPQTVLRATAGIRAILSLGGAGAHIDHIVFDGNRQALTGIYGQTRVLRW